MIPAVWCFAHLQKKIIHFQIILGINPTVTVQRMWKNSAFFRRSVDHFSSKFCAKLRISFFVQNTEFCDFVCFFCPKRVSCVLNLLYTAHIITFYLLCVCVCVWSWLLILSRLSRCPLAFLSLLEMDTTLIENRPPPQMSSSNSLTDNVHWMLRIQTQKPLFFSVVNAVLDADDWTV